MLIKLSKNNCPNCKKMDVFMNTPKMKEYGDKIVEVNMDLDPTRYSEVMNAVPGVMGLPALVDEKEGKILAVGFNPGTLTKVLKEHFG